MLIYFRLEEENHNLKEKHMKFSVQLQNEEINLPSSVSVSILIMLIYDDCSLLCKNNMFQPKFNYLIIQKLFKY